ncbi:MAG: peptidoglycan DD-metalloendopeptidase family protein [Anaerolineae bacterium]
MMIRPRCFLFRLTAVLGLMSCAAPPASQGKTLALANSSVVTPVPAADSTKIVAAAPALPTAVPTSQPTPSPTIALPTLTNPPDAALEQTAANFGAAFVPLAAANTGIWQYAADHFIHPIALEIGAETAFLLDGGRVLRLDLAAPEPPQVLLAPGMDVAGVRVLEPLDLALSGDTLLVLDRAGDVYGYDLLSGTWFLDRDDRPVRDTSGLYFVALAGMGNGRYLLETNYKYTMRYAAGEPDQLWTLPETRAVDVSASEAGVYVLLRAMDDLTGQLNRYQETRLLASFRPQVEIVQPRQVVATDTAVYVLDMAGRRLLMLDGVDGRLLTLYQLPQDDPVSVFAVTEAGQIVLAGRDRLYFYQQPDRLTAVAGGAPLVGPQPHDPAVLAQLPALLVPIQGSGITRRDFQLPGAPRHYRLGIHQGVDFYWQPGTLVRAAADGVVVRSMVDFVPQTAAQYAAWRAELQQLGYTSEAALDVYRGRQVWIQHASGWITRYVHLSRIEPGIVEGTAVTQGQLLGAVGNSGSPLSLQSAEADAHLHFELWLGEHYLGQYLRPIETRELVESLLGGQ